MKLFKRLKLFPSESILKKVEKAHLFRRYFLLVIAVLLHAIAYNLFFYNNNIVYGGVSGISILTKSLIEPSIMIFVLNIVLLLMSLFLLGKKMTFNSLVGSLLYPVFVALTRNIGNYITIQNDNLLLIAIVGGVSVGFAAGIVFKTGFTTGGTDILNQIVSKYCKVSLGTAMLMTDGLITLAGGFFFGWTKVLYAIIVLYIINIMVDKVMLGISDSKAIYITTDEDEKIWNYLLNELNLGLTLIETRGGYTYKKDEMIMCVVSTKDYFLVREGVLQIDPKAVILVTDAYQTYKTYGSKRK